MNQYGKITEIRDNTDQSEGNPKVVKIDGGHQINDEWAHIPDHNPAKILINEKAVYAVDQAMNVVLTDIDGNVLYGNKNIFDLTLYEPAELLGGHTRIFNANFHSKEFFKDMWDTILSGKIWRGDLKNRRKDGKIIWVRLIITPLLNKEGVPFQFLALKEDITEKKEIEFRLAQKDKQLSALTNNSYDIVGILNNRGELNYLNQAMERVLGFTPFETIGSNIVDFFDENDAQKWSSILAKIIDNPNEPIRQQIKFKHKEGTMRWCDVVFTNYLEDSHIHGIVFNLRDYTKQKEATDKVKQIANYDHLTNLPNRRHFEEQLRGALKAAKKRQQRFAVLFLDLDGFKNINDTLGHEIGDGLLKEVGYRITSLFNNQAFVGRLGGDEFAAIIPNIVDYEYLHNLADTLVQAFNIPFSVSEYELNVSASIGISIYPMAGEDLKTLLKNADVAMYKAKHDGKNHYQLYTPSMDENGYKSFLLKNDLHKALEKEQFFMVYQPRVDLSTNKIVGAEALVRWSHPELGLVSHIEFISFAEESGFIIPLGEWILKNVCTQQMSWRKQGLSPVKVSINISVMQLFNPNFVEFVKDTLEQTGLEATHLEFEINAASLLNKEGHVGKAIEDLMKMGISIALDNFGAGNSAFNFLTKTKFNVLKIDRSIFKDIPSNNESYDVAHAIVKLAQKLNKTVVAEGIETHTQLTLVTKMGCNEFQGFICSKPVVAEHFENLLLQEIWTPKKEII